MQPSTILCASQFFSSWGDRMWSFAVGLYLVKLTPNSLRLAAIYGLVAASTIVLLAPLVGKWVDKNSRLKVIRVTLVLQNLQVVLCAITILLMLTNVTREQAVLYVCQVLLIILGSAANLASEGTKIAIGKDWVVVLTLGDQGLLADLNAHLRRINLVCAILAPVAVGLFMTVVSDIAGIIFICSWNVVSMFVEYFLLLKVYRSTPALAHKSIDRDRSEYEVLSKDDAESDVLVRQPVNPDSSNPFLRFKVLVSGWAVYHRQVVFLAGVSLSLLYLTVLGFNAITSGYAYSQHLSEFYVSLCYGLGSLVGIGGTFLFPILRKCFGLPRTGLVSFLMQWSMLLLCLASVWSPGSPSNLMAGRYEPGHVVNTSNCSVHAFSGSPYLHNVSSTSLYVETVTKTGLPEPVIFNWLTIDGNSSLPVPAGTFSADRSSISPKSNQPVTVNNETKASCEEDTFDYTSIVLLMVGVILSRAGLWITDLTVTQLQQENVIESERGVVGGVQSALNSLLDMTHFIITIFLPRPIEFGILIVISVSAVSVGYIIYAVFYLKYTSRVEPAKTESPADDNGSD